MQKENCFHFLSVSLREIERRYRSEINKSVILARFWKRDFPFQTFKRSQFTYTQISSMNILFPQSANFRYVNVEIMRY